jgi:hypothetical protein
MDITGSGIYLTPKVHHCLNYCEIGFHILILAACIHPPSTILYILKMQCSQQSSFKENNNVHI